MADLTQVGESKTFNYTGHTEIINLQPGKYKLECWGARGGCEASGSSYGGKGGYSTGIITLLEDTTLYINVGQWPGQSRTGGWNGGGSTNPVYAGGGASDVSLKGTNGATSWNTTNHLYSRIIVAGGGGGRGGYTYAGGYGGGLTGGNGAGSSYGGGGTQTSTGQIYDNSYGAAYGGFGYGATPGATNGEHVGAGGGGWYGGSCGGYHNNNGSGGGGSGYVYTQSTASNYPSGCLLNSKYYLEEASTTANANSQDHGKVVITYHMAFNGDAIMRNFFQNVDGLSYTQHGEDEEIYYDYNTFVPDTFTGMTLSRTNISYIREGLLCIDCYYTRNTYTLTVNHGTSHKYTYLYEEQGDLHYDKHPIDFLHKFKNWISDVPANIDLAYLHDTFFKMPASDLTISAEFADQDRVNTNIYKNIFDSLLFDLYNFQTILNGPYKQETTIFQYNHGFRIYDLLRLNQNGLYEKGIATESKYDVIGMVTQILNDHEFVLTTYGPIETNISFSSDSGILYLSDTQEGKFCTYEELTTNFYTPIGFYTGNTITLNILDSSVGDVLKKYCDTVYEHEQDLPHITETDKQNIIQEVFNNA